jgi:hypothetical protein
MRVRPTQPRSRRFHFFSIPSLLLLVRTLAPEALTATAESPFGFTPSTEQWLLAPSAITIPTHELPASHTQVPARLMSAIGGVQSDAVTMTTISHQDPRPRKVIL